MTTPTATPRPHTPVWTSSSKLALFLALTATAQVAPAQGLQTTRNPLAGTSASQPGAASSVVRVLSTRSHMQCPLPGKNTRLLSIDSPREWEDTIDHQDEITALGRKVRWAKERVLVYALESKRYAGLRLDSPTRVIRLAHGVLYWPVRQVMPESGPDKSNAPTRPCVLTTIDRAYWQRIKVVPTRP
jgi:hypothetical protein